MALAADTFALQRDDWEISYDGCAELEIRHRSADVVIAGALTFTVDQNAWRLTASRDAVLDRPAWIDPEGNVQGYLAFRAVGDRLEIHIMHRVPLFYAGELRLVGSVSFGTNSFACRTTAPTHTRVVQMASGLADSELNDSLFDIDTDTALRFEGAGVRITNEQAGRFGVQLTAQVDDAACSALILDLRRDFYKGSYVPTYRPLDKTRCPSPPTGWMSWNVYFDTAGAAENLAEARVGAAKLKPFGMEFWSIESWQAKSDRQPVRDFHHLDLSCHPEQFPDGMQALAEDIRALGFRPGIWNVPFGTGDRAWYEAHREWFLHAADGAPMRNWTGNFLLDPSQPEVREHICEMQRIMNQEWGYEFFKVDGISGRQEAYSAHFYERDEVRAAFRYPCLNPMTLCVEALRKGMGPDAVFLVCQGHYSGPEAGVADAVRIGADIVSPGEPSGWHNILNQARATLNQLFVHNIVLYNDPDTLQVGPYHAEEQARVTTTVVSLPGQMMFAGDKLAELAPERMRLLQQALPVCDVRPLDLFPIFDMRPVWDLKICRSFGQWDVVALFNWGDRDDAIAVTLAELGIPAGTRCLLYEFWEHGFMGQTSDVIRARVPARGVRLVAVHPDLGRPQWLSSDRHVTQGGVDLEHLSWDDTSRRLTGRIQLVGNNPVELCFHVPPAFELKDTAAQGALQSVVEDGDGVVRVALEAAQTRSAEFMLCF